MHAILRCLLVLLLSLSGSATGANEDFCRSSFAAKAEATVIGRVKDLQKLGPCKNKGQANSIEKERGTR